MSYKLIKRSTQDAVHDREVVTEWGRWLAPIKWQLFVTLTFPWNIAPGTADRKFKEMINSLERAMKERIGYLAGKEGKSKCGFEVPWHFHVALVAKGLINESLVENTWMVLINHQHSGERGDQNVVVQPYKDSLRGVEYIVKQSNESAGDLQHRWLEVFNPKISRTMDASHKSLRQARRSS
jgi:hypothetical protein